MLDSSPIGVFDSGLGGLTVVRAIQRYYPNKSIVYIGDNAYCPWADLSLSDLIQRCLKICSWLIEQGCKCLVAACHSVSTTILVELKEYVNRLYPGIWWLDVASLTTELLSKHQWQHVGLIGTKHTINSQYYNLKLSKITWQKLATPELVPLIENNVFETNKQILIDKIKEYLSCEKFRYIEALVLGCTHYPLAYSIFAELINVPLIDPSIMLVDKFTEDEDIACKPQLKYFFSAPNKVNVEFINNFLGHNNILSVPPCIS